MTAAYRLKGLGWLGGCSIVLLGFYLVSIQVAAERKKLDAVEAKIVSAQRDIRALETEFDVRANLVQLERWNGDTLALVAPGAGQFVRDEGALSAIRFDGGFGGMSGAGAVQTAAFVVPSVTDVTAAAPVVPAPVVEAPAAPVRAVAKAEVKAPAPQVVRTAAVKATPATPATKKAQAVAMLDRTLLSDTTLGDLMSGARAERGRLR